jgi:hypothetical protein
LNVRIEHRHLELGELRHVHQCTGFLRQIDDRPEKLAVDRAAPERCGKREQAEGHCEVTV